jgi:very-short-patch-repair endonuclease
LKINEYDSARTLKLETDGFQVLRFWNNEIFNGIDSVLEAIYEKLSTPHPPRYAQLPQGEQ